MSTSRWLTSTETTRSPTRSTDFTARPAPLCAAVLGARRCWRPRPHPPSAADRDAAILNYALTLEYVQTLLSARSSGRQPPASFGAGARRRCPRARDVIALRRVLGAAASSARASTSRRDDIQRGPKTAVASRPRVAAYGQAPMIQRRYPSGAGDPRRRGAPRRLIRRPAGFTPAEDEFDEPRPRAARSRSPTPLRGAGQQPEQAALHG
jgi:hypothetical protein